MIREYYPWYQYIIGIWPLMPICYRNMTNSRNTTFGTNIVQEYDNWYQFLMGIGQLVPMYCRFTVICVDVIKVYGQRHPLSYRNVAVVFEVCEITIGPYLLREYNNWYQYFMGVWVPMF